MHGYLVVNNFIDQNKFTELYTLLSASAVKCGVGLQIKKTGELTRTVGDFLSPRPDFAVFWDKDISCARMLEKEGIPLFNSSKAIALCDNKAYTACVLSDAVGVHMPETVLAPKTFDAFGYCNTDFVKEAVEILGLPLIIKECCGSYGQQVYMAKTLEQAKTIAESLGSKEFIMQRFIAESCGRDVRINVVGGKVIASMLRYSKNGDFRSNITAGGCMEKYEPDEIMKKMAVAACEALGLDFAGVDVMFGKDGEPYICEVNSNPHFKSTLDCTGIDLSEYIMKHIKSVLCKTDG